MGQSVAAQASLVVIIFLFALALLGVWLWALVNCLTRPAVSFPGGDGNGRLLWVLLLILIPLLGLLLYLLLVYFPGRPRRYPKNKSQSYYSDRR